MIYGPRGHLGPLLPLIADVSLFFLPRGKLSQGPYGGLRAQLAFMLRLMSLPAAGCCLLVVAAMARVATHFEFLEGKSYSKTCLLSTQSQAQGFSRGEISSLCMYSVRLSRTKEDY